MNKQEGRPLRLVALLQDISRRGATFALGSRDWRKSNRFLSEIRRLSKVEYEIEEANIRIESL